MTTWQIQSLRYLISGAVSNLALYAAYLGLTAMGTPPKVAMTALFLFGIALSFLLNRRWAFQFAGPARKALPRFVLVYGLAYFLNLALLTVFAGTLGWNHRWVQAAALAINALLLFLAQRYWVFARPSLPAQ